jgi:virginiamycin B lyase
MGMNLHASFAATGTAVAATIAAAALTFPVFAQNPLPEGNGKKIIQTACTVCHELSRITNAGHTAEEWDTIVHNMVMMGATLKNDQIPVVSKYLASYLPPKTKTNLPTISGSVQANFKEFKLPTRAFPHDPYAAADGSIWYSGQLGNVLGRVDPKTGQVKDYKLPSNTGPHGLVGDKDGNIWFTGNFAGYVGKLDPKTGQVTQYKTPGANDPHSLVFDQDGILWFTAQGANQVGRLDPGTGEVKLVPVPTRLAAPYGIVVSSKGVPFFCEFGANKLASIDPKTMKITEYTLPNRDTRPRRIAISKGDVLWYGDYTRGYLGMYDPKTGKAKEWKSPGGLDSAPYGITATADAIWYSESGASPNTLVRFDLKSEQFQTWKIPSGGGTVRNMMPTRDGNLAIAESGENIVALVEIK